MKKIPALKTKENTTKVRHLTKSAEQEAWKNNCKKLDLNREGDTKHGDCLIVLRENQ